MRKKMFNLALVLAGAFLFALLLPESASAQFTTVTATVKDPNGIPYAGAVLNAVLVPSTGGGYTLSGQPYSGRIGPVTLDSAGKFTVNFGDVTLITPGSPQWQITIDSAAATIQGPLGTGPQSFTYTSTGTTISGSSPVSLTTALNALAPALTNITLGSGSVTSVAATSPIVVTPSPITTTGTISCPTCNTSSATIAGIIANTQIAFGTAANTIGGNAGFTFVTPSMTIPANGIYQIGGANYVNPGPAAGSNIGIGPGTIAAMTTGVNNLAIGASALSLTTTGNSNTAVGVGALQSEGATNQKNTAVGHNTLNIVTSDSNVGVGENVLPVLTTGTGDTAVGAGAGGNTTGSNNTFLGTNAGLNDTTGGSNIIIGQGDGNVTSTGSNNIDIGTSLVSVTPTSSNTIDVGDVMLATGINTPSTSVTNFAGEVDAGTSGTSSGILGMNGSTSGKATFTAPAVAGTRTNPVTASNALLLPAGSLANPGLTFVDTSNGFWRPSANLVGFVSAGVDSFTMYNGGIRFINTDCVQWSPNATSTSTFDLAVSRTAAGVATIDTGTCGNAAGTIKPGAYATGSNCSSSASPAVCGSSAAGSVAVPTGATPTLQINTSAVTANSQILLTIDEGLGTKLSVTCNTTLATLIQPVVTARTAGTSFTIQINATLAVNPACISYFIVN